jgi:hypothetical protein
MTPQRAPPAPKALVSPVPAAGAGDNSRSGDHDASDDDVVRLPTGVSFANFSDEEKVGVCAGVVLVLARIVIPACRAPWLQALVLVAALQDHLFAGRMEAVAVIKSLELHGKHDLVTRSLNEARRALSRHGPQGKGGLKLPKAPMWYDCIAHAQRVPRHVLSCGRDRSFVSDKVHDDEKRLKKLALKLLLLLKDQPLAFRTSLLSTTDDVTPQHIAWLCEPALQSSIWLASALDAVRVIGELFVSAAGARELTLPQARSWAETLGSPTARVRFVLARAIASLRILSSALDNAADEAAREAIRNKPSSKCLCSCCTELSLCARLHHDD